MNMTYVSGRAWIAWLFTAAFVVGSASPALAKKARPAATTPSAEAQPAIKAELAGTVALASIKISRVALADDPSLADVKDEVTGLYDRQEAATKDALAKLKAAAGDSAKVTEAVNALGTADDESAKYFAKNPETKEKIAKRVALINTEIEQITKAPADYIAVVKKADVSPDTLTKVTTIVNYASKNQRKYRDSDAALKGRTEVRKLLLPAQTKALDAALAPK